MISSNVSQKTGSNFQKIANTIKVMDILETMKAAGATLKQQTSKIMGQKQLLVS